MNNCKNSQFEKQARKYKNYYFNKFISLKCAEDMIRERLFPNAKEITESFAAFEATKYLPKEFNWKNKDVNVICVGDGHKARTGATFSLRTAWNAISVDPLLNKLVYKIRRLEAKKDYIQNLRLKFSGPTLICCVHSHAKLTQCLEAITSPLLYIINMPCCVKPDLKIKPFMSYQDDNIWSEKNTVELYNVAQ